MLDYYRNLGPTSYLDEEEAMPPGHIENALIFLRINGWYIFISMLLMYHLWMRIVWPFLPEWMKVKKEEEKKMTKPTPEPTVNVNKNSEDGRRAAVERLQKSYNEDILKMKKIAEEKENKKRQKYLSNMPDISPGRKLNESHDQTKGKEKLNHTKNKGTPYPPDTSGNRHVL